MAPHSGSECGIAFKVNATVWTAWLVLEFGAIAYRLVPAVWAW